MGCNVLISSAGRRVSLLRIFKKALSKLGLEGEVFASDMSKTAPVFHVADRGFLVPRCTDPDFIPRTLQLCRDHNIKLIVPTIDPELAVFANHRELFAAEGVHINISAPETVAIASEKVATHRWLTENQFPCPRQCTLEEALENPDEWPFPLVTKPAAGSRSIGFRLCHSRQELEDHSDTSHVIQSVATGTEYTVSFFVDVDGDVPIAVPRQRLEVRSGEVSKGVARNLPEVIELAKTVGRALPAAFGALNVQIFHDAETGALNVIEINPRFGGGFPLAYAAGAHFPDYLISIATGLPYTSATSFEDGLAMLRFDEAVFVKEQDWA